MKPKVQLVTQLKKEHKKSNMHILQIFLVIVSLALGILSVNDLNPEDRVSITRGTLIFIYGLVFYTALFHALNGVLLRTSTGQRFTKKYKLCVADVYDINNKQVSAVQALFCCITGLTCCTYSCQRDMLHTSHYISEAYAWFGAAYFLYDIWSMYKVHVAKMAGSLGGGSTNSGSQQVNGEITGGRNKTGNEKKPPQRSKLGSYLMTHGIIVGHHIFIGAFGFLVITYLRGGLGDCFFGFVYLMEASTPFVSARGILSKIGMKTSRLYVVNGLVMLLTFFLCRVAMFPCVIYLYARSVGLDYVSAVRSLPTGCKISILTLLLPQVYWFHLMLKGATQVLLLSSNSSATSSQTTSAMGGGGAASNSSANGSTKRKGGGGGHHHNHSYSKASHHS